MKQIKIENNGVEQLITVPENSKVTIDGNVVVFEPKFKKGDCVIGKGSCHPKKAKFVEFVKDECGCRYDNNSNGCHFRYLRLATIEEKNETLSDLKAEGKQWNAEKLCIEDLKAVPKVGDYVVLKATSLIIYCKVVESYCNIIKFKLCLKNGIVSSIGSWELNISGCEEKILSEEQFQSELAQLGFEYNFENDTISELKWKPKKGETIYYFDYKLDIESDEYDEDCNLDKEMYANGNCFKTKELCQQAIDKIKQVLSEK